MLQFFFVLALFLQHQEGKNTAHVSPKADAVISSFVRAKGGESALTKIKDYTIKGEVVSGNKVVGTFESFQAANRHLSIHRFPDGSSRQHGTDGKIAWNLDVNGNPSILNGQEARDYMRHYETMHESLEWKNQFAAILYAGEKTSGNEAVHHLIFVANDNRQINRYFSTESGLLIREEQINGATETHETLK